MPMVAHLVVTVPTKIEIEASHTLKTRSADGIRMTTVTAENEIQKVNYMKVCCIVRIRAIYLNTDKIRLYRAEMRKLKLKNLNE